MAKTKASGSTRLGRDSESKRLGIKLHDGQFTRPGQVLVRQRGTKYLPGINVARGGDDTLYALASGKVKYVSIAKRRYDGNVRKAARVDVLPKANE